MFRWPSRPAQVAATLCAEGHVARATRLCAAASALRQRAQTLRPPAEREAMERVVAAVRAAQDPAAFTREWTRGSRLTQEEAIEEALAD